MIFLIFVSLRCISSYHDSRYPDKISIGPGPFLTTSAPIYPTDFGDDITGDLSPDFAGDLNDFLNEAYVEDFNEDLTEARWYISVWLQILRVLNSLTRKVPDEVEMYQRANMSQVAHYRTSPKKFSQSK